MTDITLSLPDTLSAFLLSRSHDFKLTPDQYITSLILKEYQIHSQTEQQLHYLESRRKAIRAKMTAKDIEVAKRYGEYDP